MRESGASHRFGFFGILGLIFRVFWGSGAHFPSILRLRSSFCSIPEAPELFLKAFEGSGATNSIILHLEIQTFSHFVATMSLISSCCSYKFIDFVVLYLSTIILSFYYYNYNNDIKPITKPTTHTTTNTATTGFSSAVLGFSSRLQLSSLGL